MPSSREPGRKVVVLGVPWQTEDATLERHFSQFGVIEEAQIMRERYTRKSRGFGFVSFASSVDAQRAVATEHVIDGRRCEAKYALPEGKVGSARTTRIFIARIPSSVSDMQFRSYFEQFGAVQDAYMPKDPSKQGHRGIGFVTYASAEAVERVMSSTHVLNGNEIAIDRATPKERGALLPGRPFMSQPNLHMLASGGAGGSMHSGVGFPFMRPVGVPAPSGAYRDPHAAGAGYGLGNRRMSQPVISTGGALVGSPPGNARSDGGPLQQQQQQQQQHASLSGLASQYSASGANLNLLAQAQAQAAALQQQLSSNSLSSLEGNSPAAAANASSQQQQLLNLINANVSAATAAAAAASAPMPPGSRPAAGHAAGGLNHNGSSTHLAGSTASSSGDLAGLLAQQQQKHQQQQYQQQQQEQQQQQMMAAAAVAAAAAAAGGTWPAGPRQGGPGPMVPPSTTQMPPTVPAGPPSARAGPRIFVGKLPRDASEQDVKEYFSRFGFVLDVYLPRDKANKREHRGFGFVTFETDAAIQRVVSHGPHHIRGAIVAIDSAVPRQEELVLAVDHSGGGTAAGNSMAGAMVGFAGGKGGMGASAGGLQRQGPVPPPHVERQADAEALRGFERLSLDHGGGSGAASGQF